MTNLRYHILTLSAVLLSMVLCLPAKASDIEDELKIQLQKAKTPADSLPILLDLFDLKPRDLTNELGLQTYGTALRAGDESAALEMIRDLANRNLRNDSMLVDLYEKTKKHPDSNAKKETLAFIKMRRNVHRAKYSKDTNNENHLRELLDSATMAPPKDLYNHIVMLHAVCTLVAQASPGDLLCTYLDSLGNLVSQLPADAYSLRNAYAIYAAVAYSDNNQHEKAVATDKKTLEAIKSLEKYYKSKGREYRNYASNYYIIYNRLLSNFAILSEKEVETYHRLAMEYVEADPIAKATFAEFPGPDIYYALYHKDYNTALQLLKKSIDNDYTRPYKRVLLKHLITAAQHVGDKETLMNASLEYNTILENYIKKRIDEKYKELQIAYDIYHLKDNYARLELEKHNSESKRQKQVLIISSISLCVLLILVLILFRLYRKNRSLVKTLKMSNDTLKTERDNLRQSRSELLRTRDQAQKANNLKGDFIKNMSYEVMVPLQAINEYSKLLVDCSDATNKPYLERFANLIDLNSELLSTIVNDVLRLSEIEGSSMPIHNHVIKLRTLCRAAIDSVRHRLKPGVTLILDPEAPDIDAFSDPQRIQQILLNMLVNAAKFTDKGSITLSYRVDERANKIIFTVTDTGIGINPENKEKIFDRFVKLDKSTQGAGLGLTISRLIARLLGGDLVLDTKYTQGARFVFTLPRK